MPVITQTTSSVASGTYGQANDIIGQLKTMLLNDPAVTIISDNNPATSIPRVVDYKVGNSRHMRLTPCNSSLPTYIGNYMMNIANNSIVGGTVGSFGEGVCQNQVIKLIYGPNNHLLKGPFMPILLTIGEDGVRYAMNVGNGNTFDNSTDTTKTISAPAYTGGYADGSIPLVKVACTLAGVFQTIFPKFYTAIATLLTTGNFYTDSVQGITYYVMDQSGVSGGKAVITDET